MRGPWSTTLWVALALVACGAAIGLLLRDPHPKKGSTAATAARSALTRDSAQLLRGVLEDVSLGMTMTEVLRSHPGLKREPSIDREELVVYQEQLAARARSLYFFEADPHLLVRVQVAEELPGAQAVVDRVLQRQQRFGPPSGVWDCPSIDGQLPTRRYTFRRGSASAADVYTLLGDRALATYYVASSARIAASLEQAGCGATPPERAARFPAVPLPAR